MLQVEDKIAESICTFFNKKYKPLSFNYHKYWDGELLISMLKIFCVQTKETVHIIKNYDGHIYDYDFNIILGKLDDKSFNQQNFIL